ncbi:hypothetical protein MPSEU_000308300 [Mayamaea pseudoterrestris]|nr:hypothetical protein MPSEU_000308300 [Mayamaea pseudoterrestris]
MTNPRNASTLFAFLGHKASAPVTLIDVKTLELVTNKATPVYTPLGEVLFDLKNLERPVLEELLKLETNASTPLVSSACFPIPPLAIEAIAKHGPYDIEGILSAFMSTLATWPDQFDKQVPTDKLIQSCFPFIQLLWWGVRLTTTKPSKPELSILHQLPKAPVTLESNTIPEDVTLDLLEATKLAGITAAASTPAISTPRTDDDSDVDSDEDPKNQPPIDLNNNNQLRSMLATLMTSVAQITKVHAKKDKLAANRERRHAEETKRRDEERKRVDENQRLLIEQKYKSGESSSTGFSKLLPENQLMIRRLAACIDGVEPFRVSHKLLCVQERCGSLVVEASLRAPTMLSLLLAKGCRCARSRTSRVEPGLNHEHLLLNLRLVVVHSTDDLCDRQALANNQVEGSTMKKIAGDIVWEFPSDGNALVRGLFKYAVYFDVLAGLSPTSGTSTLIAQKIRSLASTLANRIDKMQTLQNQDPDAIAQFANTIDTKINIFLNHCFKDAIFDPTRLDELETLDKYLDCGFSSILCTIPSFLLERLPSHRFAKRGAGQPPGGASPPVIKQAKTGDEGGAGARQFQARINPNKLDIPAGHTYQSLCPPGSFRRSPRIKIGNKAGRPCLNYYLRGECRYRICQNMHGPLRPQDKVKLEAFIAAQAANPNGDANPPAAADEDES